MLVSGAKAMAMRTVTLDDQLVARAMDLTGITERTTLLRPALTALVWTRDKRLAAAALQLDVAVDRG